MDEAKTGMRGDWERAVLGANGIAGTVRMVGYIVAFALVFGTFFYFVR